MQPDPTAPEVKKTPLQLAADKGRAAKERKTRVVPTSRKAAVERPAVLPDVVEDPVSPPKAGPEVPQEGPAVAAEGGGTDGSGDGPQGGTEGVEDGKPVVTPAAPAVPVVASAPAAPATEVAVIEVAPVVLGPRLPSHAALARPVSTLDPVMQNAFTRSFEVYLMSLRSTYDKLVQKQTELDGTVDQARAMGYPEPELERLATLYNWEIQPPVK